MTSIRPMKALETAGAPALSGPATASLRAFSHKCSPPPPPPPNFVTFPVLQPRPRGPFPPARSSVSPLALSACS